MNKNQRRTKTFRSDVLTRSKLAHELSSVTKNKSPTGIRIPRSADKTMVNRCCLVHPKQKDFGQITKLSNGNIFSIPHNDQYSTILSEQDSFNPVHTKAITEVKEGKHVLCGHEPKVENSSQYDYIRNFFGPKFVETADGTQWQNIDNINDIDKYIQATVHREPRAPTEYRSKPMSIHISEVPKVKIIVEKFSKYKQHNVELRRLDEKVVCLEYDIFDYGSAGAMDVPIQTMRAFFSVKPASGNGCEPLPLSDLPADVKHKFNILDEDIKKLTVKEIEIIDDSIENNKCYLDDLRRILKRKEFINANKGKSSIDLKTLYEMARRENEMFYSDITGINLFSKSELRQLKDLIVHKCTSSAHGISRRTVKSGYEAKLGEGVISGSIVSELMRS